MANTSNRTLRLLSLLQNHGHWTGTELADRLEVSPRTLRRDIDRLRELGYPVEARRGIDGGYQLEAGAVLPPLVLDDDEAVALVVGLQSAAQGAVTGIAESSVRALAKVVQVLPTRLRRRAEALSAMTEPAVWGSDDAAADAAVLTLLAQAARNTERIEIDYVDREGEATRRKVEPLRLVVLGRRWYLVAWDLTRHDWRSFRVDRIASTQPTGAHFPVRVLPAADAATFVRASIGSVSASHVVEATVDSPADVVQARVGRWATVEPADKHTCRLRMTTNTLDWAVTALMGLNADFTVAGPPALIDQLDARARRLRRAANRSRAAASAP